MMTALKKRFQVCRVYQIWNVRVRKSEKETHGQSLNNKKGYQTIRDWLRSRQIQPVTLFSREANGLYAKLLDMVRNQIWCVLIRCVNSFVRFQKVTFINCCWIPRAVGAGSTNHILLEINGPIKLETGVIRKNPAPINFTNNYNHEKLGSHKRDLNNPNKINSC